MINEPLLFYGIWVMSFIAFPIGRIAASYPIKKIRNTIDAVIAGLIAGLIIGLVQLLVLSTEVALDFSWVLATAGGLAIGLAITMLLVQIAHKKLHLSIKGLVPGLIIGFYQWLILQNFTPLAGWWIPTVAFSWTIGMMVSKIVGSDMSKRWPLFGASGGLVYTIMTGLVLFWML